MARVLLVIASIALTIYALADCVTTDESRCQRLPKIIWVLLIVFVPWIGPIVWLLIGKDRKQPGATGLNAEFQDYFSPTARAARRAKKQPKRPLAPDEDPEFLAQLDKQIREERRAKYQNPEAAGEPKNQDDPVDPGATPEEEQDDTDPEKPEF